MNNLWANLPHMIMATVVIVVVTILALNHIITGTQTVGMIAAAGGFTLGAGSASVSTFATTGEATVTSTSPSHATEHV